MCFLLLFPLPRGGSFVKLATASSSRSIGGGCTSAQRRVDLLSVCMILCASWNHSTLNVQRNHARHIKAPLRFAYTHRHVYIYIHKYIIIYIYISAFISTTISYYSNISIKNKPVYPPQIRIIKTFVFSCLSSEPGLSVATNVALGGFLLCAYDDVWAHMGGCGPFLACSREF